MNKQPTKTKRIIQLLLLQQKGTEDHNINCNYNENCKSNFDKPMIDAFRGNMSKRNNNNNKTRAKYFFFY